MIFCYMYFVQIEGLKIKNGREQRDSLRVIPMPQSTVYAMKSMGIPRSLSLSTNLPVEYNFITTALNDSLNFTFNCIIQQKERSEFEYLYNLKADTLDGKIKQRFNEEGYVMELKSNDDNAGFIFIGANSPNGIFYGLQTLSQMVFFSEEAHQQIQNGFEEIDVPMLSILDYPDFSLRGISDDISRGQAATKEGIKAFIRELSRYKLNHYFLYIEDVFKFAKHPDIGVNRGALTPEDIKDIEQYAKQRFVKLTPIFESLGHMDNILCLPKYHHLGEFPGSDCLDVSNPECYELLDELYSDITRAFESEYFHLGLDESWELGTYKGRANFLKKGKELVYSEHYTKVYELAKKYGKKEIIFYADIAVGIPGVLSKLPKDIIAMYWDYGIGKNGEYPKMDLLINAGLKTIVSPAVHDWARFFPNITRMEQNTYNIISYGFKKGAFGVIQSSWGDFRNENLRWNRIYGFIYAAVASWNVEKFDKTNIWNSILTTLYGTSEAKEDWISLFKRFYDQKIFKNKDGYLYFWAHPFSLKSKGFKTKGYADELQKLNTFITGLENSKSKIKHNQLTFDTMIGSANIYRYFVKKMLYCSEINRYGDALVKNKTKKQKEHCVALLDELIEDLSNLKREYARIWSADCSTDNLGPLLLQYDQTIGIYKNKIDALKTNQPWSNPNIPAYWIYSFKKKSLGTDHKAFFITNFQIEDPNKIKFAKIQVIGDTHWMLYINGKKIKEGFSKRTLSLLMLNSFKQIIDITQYLKQGVNEIAIENHNYQGGFGIINVYGEIRSFNGELQTLKTDRSWKISEMYPEPDSQKQMYAGVLVPPPYLNGTLTFPDFEFDLPSFSTFILGMGSIALRYVPWGLKWLQKGLSKLASKFGLIV